MGERGTRAISDVLDKLEEAASDESITVGDVVEVLGHHSTASLMLIFSLICASPASAIPGLTALTALIIFILAAQMALGRDTLWLPQFIYRRKLSTARLCQGISWLRKPVRFVERLLKRRLTFLLHRPWFFLPLLLILGLSMFMPFMEVIPTSGSIAASVVAIFAAGVLTRDGLLVVLSMILLLAVPVAVWHFGFSGGG